MTQDHIEPLESKNDEDIIGLSISILRLSSGMPGAHVFIQ